MFLKILTQNNNCSVLLKNEIDHYVHLIKGQKHNISLLKLLQLLYGCIVSSESRHLCSQII